MVELQILARYPFLTAAKDYVKENALSVHELLTDPLYDRARVIGLERLENAFEKRDVGNRTMTTDSDCIMELLSYPLSRMIAVCVDDTYFKRRYALGEAVQVYNYLLKEKTSFILDIANEFHLDVHKEENTSNVWVHFTDYLHYAPTRYKQWKMTNRGISKGYIKLTSKDLIRLIQEALRLRINDELDERQCNPTVRKIFSDDIQRFKNKVLMHRKKIEAAPMGKLDVTKLPPCMKKILSAIQAGENVPHMGRFALVAFLHSLKLSTTDILKLFSSAPDYEEEKTRYQVEHITGSSSATSYKAPGCDKMRTYGICPSEEIDEFCKRYHHPLSYYKAQWRKNTSKKKEASP